MRVLQFIENTFVETPAKNRLLWETRTRMIKNRGNPRETLTK